MVDTIINGFDVWTDALGVKSKGRVKSIENISLEGVARLRELILELAVRGELVPQDPNDEPASELLKVIKNERKLIETSKQKEASAEPKFTTKKIGWEFCKLEDIGDTNIGLTYSPQEVSDKGTIVLRSSNIQNGEIELSDIVRVDKTLSSNILVTQGDLLICARNGSKKLVGKCALIRNLPEPMAFGAFMAIFRCEFNEYVRIFIESPIYRRNLEGVSTTTINQITQDNLKNTYIPLPPLAEQHRIVAKVDELMALCDELEAQHTNNLKTHQLLVKTILETLILAADVQEFQASWSRMFIHFDTLFCTDDSIEQLKETILQLAIMGKLVRQDPNDEPASELIKKIAKEKEQLIKEGKIKKQKPLPQIKETEKPFALPSGWEWARPDDFSSKITDGEHFRPQTQKEGVYFLSAKDIKADGVSLDDPLFVSKEIADVALQRCNPEKGDILIVSRGGTVGRMCTVDIDDIFCLLGSVILIKPMKLINSEYLKVLMKSPHAFSKLITASESTAQPAIYLRDLKKIVFPIAPVLEQERIVKKVYELFTICDSLKERILKSQDLKVLLSKTIVENAVQ